jgi:hypothetical protein
MPGPTAVVLPAPGDVEETITERARAAYRGTQRGRFTLSELVQQVNDATEHEPFPLVRRAR